MESGDSNKSVSRENTLRRAYVKNVLQFYFAYAWKDQPAQKIDFSKNRKFDEAVQDGVQNHARKSILHGFIELWDIDWDNALSMWQTTVIHSGIKTGLYKLSKTKSE